MQPELTAHDALFLDCDGTLIDIAPTPDGVIIPEGLEKLPGRLVRSLFEELLSRRDHVGLLPQDFPSDTGEPWGNFLQTYSMVGIIVAAMRLSKGWESAR